MLSDEKPLTEKRVIDLAKAAQILIVATGTGLIIAFGLWDNLTSRIQKNDTEIKTHRVQTEEFQRNIRDRLDRIEDRL